MIREIKRTVYETSDKQEFHDLTEAKQHELALTVAEMLDDSNLYFGRDGVSTVELARWIIDNMGLLEKAVTDA